jgi:hypothetical protein
MDQFIHIAFHWAFVVSEMAAGVCLGTLLARLFTKERGFTRR